MPEAVYSVWHNERNVVSEVMGLAKNYKPFATAYAYAGSVLRNPPSDRAARLFQTAASKGKHGRPTGIHLACQFDCQSSQATAEDVITLMQQIHSNYIISKRYNLVPEVFPVGER
ncbi:hypothetical protein [Paenibacillus illinoisensis]|uniref:UDP-N-acetylenolpyruvoylglucosamine reductase n=1 Tax=Paenibacillus illinoisensis TaxID=59845 RepID=A0A2W0CGH2_9BACL|nr:hypothetical protein [Paenibacillus illinoisensis]PYY27425.1 UDP-N-acetylenolpyruvoylglucosamine reductase [Paenibacillus illinoisensis]